jgi:DeoR family transcriptional regulator, suf operon transcriptional repressor
MQQTRQYILEVLHERGEATVDEIVQDLRTRINHEITAVTVRHHLDILRGEELVTPPSVRRRRTPGRPQYVYGLTEKALELFPNNYQNLAATLLNQIKANLPPSQVNVILEKVADEMISSASVPNVPFEARLDYVVSYLNQQGYEAEWESTAEGFVLRTRNCPYRQIAGSHEELCSMDFRLITGLLGVIPRRLGRLVEQDDSCSYLIPVPQGAVAVGQEGHKAY